MSSCHSAEPDLSQFSPQVRVTSHARRRYLERVDGMEPYPAAAIRQAWRVVWNGDDQSDDHTNNHPDHGVERKGIVLVYDVKSDGPAIVTVYPDETRTQPGAIRA